MKKPNKPTLCAAIALAMAGNAVFASEPSDSTTAANDTTGVISLNEVEVVAERVIHKGDHEVLLLSEENRTFGTNALDAISSLVYFNTSLNGRTLTNDLNQNVYILINGVPADGDRLRTYKGDDIKKVEYYAIAPPKYTIFTFGPIVNVITKKKRDQQYDGYFNTSNAVATGYGFNQANLTYTDSLNMVKAGYWVNYRNIGNIGEHSEYNYDKLGRSTAYDTKRRYEGAKHNISAEYQRYQGNHLFNVSVVGVINPGEQNSSGTSLLTEGTQAYTGTSQSHLKSRANSINTSIYYGLTKGRTSFAVSANGAFGKSYSDAWSKAVMPEPYSQYSYDNNSRLDNTSYTLNSYALVTTPWLGGNFSTVAAYNYSQIKQEYSGNTVTPHTHDVFINTAMSWNFNNELYVFETLGASVYSEYNGTQTRTVFSPRLFFSINWWPKSVKGFNSRLDFVTTKNKSTLSSLSKSFTYKDNWFIFTGNPELKGYWTSSGTLLTSYRFGDSGNKITASYSLSYSDNPFINTLEYDNGMVIAKQYEMSYRCYHSLTIKGSWFPFKWLELAPYIEYDAEKYSTLTQRYNHKHFRFGGSVILRHKALTLTLAANSSGRTWAGDFADRFSAQYAAVVQYKWRNWAFGAQWHYFGHNDYESGSIPGFNYIISSEYTKLHNLVQLDAIYYFSIGRSRKHAGKMLSNGEGVDSGLNSYNKGKISQ